MSFRKALLLTLTLATAASSADALRASIVAMACCAKAHHECAGVKTPDDCCRSRGHLVSAPPSVAPSARDGISFAAVVTPLIAPGLIDDSRPLLADPAFKRPHDPPHLHPFPLLI
jgi:hypothetical protein